MTKNTEKMPSLNRDIGIVLPVFNSYCTLVVSAVNGQNISISPSRTEQRRYDFPPSANRPNMHLSDVFLSILLGLPSISPAFLANAQQGPADTRARHLFEVFAADDTGGHSYAPYNVTCPTNLTWIRPADSLGKVEKDYLTARNPQIKSAWSTRTSNLNLTAPPRTPVVAIALSGGGYRAMISGSGQAFLQNNTKGSAGDILALSTYVGGLSGGSWAVSSFFANDGLSADELAQNVRTLFTGACGHIF